MTDSDLTYARLQQPYSSGPVDEIADLLHPKRTSAQLADATDPINLLDKFEGKCVYDTTQGIPRWAAGAAASAAWLSSPVMPTEAGAGITDGTGTIYKSGVTRSGGVIVTSILMDLTGLSSATSDLDIIGIGTSAAHIGQITAAVNGTILGGRMTCLELPASLTDIDLYAADEGTGKFEDGIAALAETALVTKGGAWAAGAVNYMTGLPAADQYLYLTNGAADTADPFTAGRFLIELFGY